MLFFDPLLYLYSQCNAFLALLPNYFFVMTAAKLHELVLIGVFEAFGARDFGLDRASHDEEAFIAKPAILLYILPFLHLHNIHCPIEFS